MSKKILNLLLRGTSLSFRFFLIIYVARFYSHAETYIFGVVSSLVVLGVYLFGLEMHIKSMRIIVVESFPSALNILLSQIIILTPWILLVVIIFLNFSSFITDSIGVHLLVFLVVSEYISQELYRFHLAREEQIFSSLLLLIRSSIWVLLVLAHNFLLDELLKINEIIFIWFVFSLLSIVVSFCKLKKACQGFIFVLNSDFIVPSIKAGLLFFLMIILHRSFLTFDRVYIEDFSGQAAAAMYVMYASIAFALVSLFEAAVSVFYYPKLIIASENNNSSSFKLLAKNYAYSCAIFLMIMCPLSYVSLKFIISSGFDAIYADGLDGAYLSLLVMIIAFLFSQVIHHILLARNLDSVVFFNKVYGYLATALVFSLLHFFFFFDAVDMVIFSFVVGNFVSLLLGFLKIKTGY